MEKINLVELLKDCIGMELDCVIFGDVTLYRIDTSPENEYPIRIETKSGNFLDLTKYGTYSNIEEAKCVIFPKGKTTWDGFVPPCKFKDGDIVFTSTDICSWISIFKQFSEKSCFTYTDLCIEDNDLVTDTDTSRLCLCHLKDIKLQRIATEEEREKLFQVIRDNGYKWNEETKTLEKLPEFMIDEDEIKHEESGNILNYKTINNMNKKNFHFEVHCRNTSETRDTLDWPSDDLFSYDSKYSDLLDYFAEYLNDIEDGPYTQFKADDNNPYSSADVEGFEKYLYYKQDGIYIQFNVDKGKITDWTWDDKPDEKYKCLEYNDFIFMIEQDIYKSDSTEEKIITSDIVDKYYNKSNTNTNNKTEDITIKSTPEINFDILFDYGTMIGIDGRFVRKSDISAFVREECDVDKEDEGDEKRYFTVVVLKSGVKLTFHDLDYEDFVAELDKYYRIKGDIFEEKN